MAKTGIEWTDDSLNPLLARLLETGKTGWHCELASPGCVNCYAQALNRRNLPNAGTGLDYVRSSRDRVELYLDQKRLLEPFKWRKPRTVFLCSMTDLFGEFVPDELIDPIMALCLLTPENRYIVLTKRAERLYAYTRGPRLLERLYNARKSLLTLDGAPTLFGDKSATAWPPPNVIFGVSAENQEWADERIPYLLRSDVRYRCVSYEPAIGPIDFFQSFNKWLNESEGTFAADLPRLRDYLHWIIVGGESGPKARWFAYEWAASTVLYQLAGVPVFVKQLGKNVYVDKNHPECNRVFQPDEIDSDEAIDALGEYLDHIHRLPLKHPKGGDPREWPAEIRVRQFPNMLRLST